MNEVILGIDLGTTHSLVGVFESGFPILLADGDGKRIVPSAVCVDGEDVLVGHGALRALGSGKKVVTSVKRALGREDVDVDFDAVEMSAAVLRQLREVAVQRLELDAEEEIKAVISVPAYFNDLQRTATVEAGKRAGLEVVRIISEPTAAALAYGLDKLEEKSKIAVYDYGGGTFDVSVLELRDGVFQVLATAGDTHLGGDDLDALLLDWSCEKLSFQPKTKEQSALLMSEVRKAKEKLSKSETAVLSLPFIDGATHLELEVSRREFEALIAEEIRKTEKFCRLALHDAALDEALDAVVLVGGTTRIPAVQALVKEIFNQEPDTSQHPDEAVALGAVIQAGILSGAVQEVLLLDVTPLSLGIETFGGLMNVLIPRNSTIPCKAGEMFTNAVAGQRSMRVRVLQGEREMARDNWQLGSFEVDFEPLPKGQARVGVQFSIDENGILQMLARDMATGVDTIHELQSAAVDVDDESVERMVSESVDFAFEDMAQRVFAEAKIKAEELLPAVDEALAVMAGSIDDVQKKSIREAREHVVVALADGEANTLKAAVQKLDAETEYLAALLVEKAMEEALARRMGDA